MNTYDTLANLRAYLDFEVVSSQITQEDSTLLALLNQASRAIDRYTRRKFYPRLETRRFDLTDNKRQIVDDDLLEVTTFTTQNGASTIASSVFWLACGPNWNRLPADRIVIDDSAGSLLNFVGTPQRSQSVAGYWGYHEEWSSAWTDTGTSLTANLGATDASLSLAGAGSFGANASDINFDHPRLAVGDLIKIGDEFIEILGGAASGNGTPLIKRGVNGTTAASHPSATSLAKFAPEADIRWCTRRLAAWSFGQKSAPYTTRVVTPGFGGQTIEIPESWPGDVRERIGRFKRSSVIQVMPDKNSAGTARGKVRL